MIEQVLNERWLLDGARPVVDALRAGLPATDNGPAPLDATEAASVADALDAAVARRSATDTSRRGDAGDDHGETSFFPRDALLSILQSAVEQHVEERRHDLLRPSAPARRGPQEEAVTDRALADDVSLAIANASDRRVLRRFEPTDVRWIASLVAMGVRWLNGPVPFNDTPAEPVALAADARVVLVSDWATALPRARKVAALMRREIEQALAAGRQAHVAHLGDVYYSGWEREYERRFLDQWPVDVDEVDRVWSWNLNGNHDMYSGGHGYYDVCLADPRFERQQRSSFFLLRNEDWQVFGLDTAYDDHGLRDPQGAWVRDRVRASAARAVLLSHHQPFSVHSDQGPRLVAALEGVLQKRGVDAWFWGHEHRCVAYSPHQGVAAGRLIGYGGVPVYAHGRSEALTAPAEYEYRGYLPGGLERWAKFGFAVLDFDGPRLRIRYIDEDGAVHRSEEL